MEAAAQFNKKHGYTRLSEGDIAALDIGGARDTIRLLQYLLSETISTDPVEALGNKAYMFFRDYRKAGARWKQPDSAKRSVLPPTQRRIAGALLYGIGEHNRLFASVYADRIIQGTEPESRKSLEVLICQMRPMFAAAGFAIHSIRGVGYEIENRAVLKGIIEQHAATGFDFSQLTPLAPSAPPAANPTRAAQ